MGPASPNTSGIICIHQMLFIIRDPNFATPLGGGFTGGVDGLDFRVLVMPDML